MFLIFSTTHDAHFSIFKVQNYELQKWDIYYMLLISKFMDVRHFVQK